MIYMIWNALNFDKLHDHVSYYHNIHVSASNNHDDAEFVYVLRRVLLSISVTLFRRISNYRGNNFVITNELE